PAGAGSAAVARAPHRAALPAEEMQSSLAARRVLWSAAAEPSRSQPAPIHWARRPRADAARWDRHKLGWGNLGSGTLAARPADDRRRSPAADRPGGRSGDRRETSPAPAAPHWHSADHPATGSDPEHAAAAPSD